MTARAGAALFAGVASRPLAPPAPRTAEGWRALGDRLHADGDEAGGDRAHLAALRCSTRDPELLAAADALMANDLPRAEPLLRARLKAQPTDIAAIRMLAELAGRIGRNRDAETLLRRALDLAPGFTPARHNLALALHRQGRSAEALVEVEELIAREPENPGYANLKAAALGRLGNYDEAATLYRAVLSRQPRQPKVWMSLGHALKTLGRQAESIAAYRESLALRPTLGEAWWSLANLKTVRFSAEDVAAMRTALATPDLEADDIFHLEFALGKAEEDAANYAASFAHYAEGNRRRRALIHHDADEVTTTVDRLISTLTPAFLAERRGWGCEAADPIFVVSLPRSGSTLVEQILASHSTVEGTMELPDLAALFADLGPEGLRGLDAARARALGEDYLRRTQVQRKTGRPRFIDKMPNNWVYAGLIQLILPNATIVDARRDPLACGFSVFKQHFARGQGFAYDLTEIGRYYRDYARMMAHVDTVLPGRVHRVVYERMVADTETEVRALLAGAGLPFEPACLRFHETERAVRTASSEQVRQPIFRDGVNQWRHFAPWLGPLRDALGPLADDAGSAPEA